MTDKELNEFKEVLSRWNRGDLEDWSDLLNTPLTAEERLGYEKYVASLSESLRNTRNYDLQGAYKASLEPSFEGHLGDRFKKPNHPTFSVESQYNGYAGLYGGKWGDKTFTPGNAHKKWTPIQLLQYFANAEPGYNVEDNRLIRGMY